MFFFNLNGVPKINCLKDYVYSGAKIQLLRTKKINELYIVVNYCTAYTFFKITMPYPNLHSRDL